MFGRRYFAGRYFAPRFYPDGGSGTTTSPVDLYEALSDLLSADGTLVGLFGRDDWFWLDTGPVDDSLPYAVLGDPDGDISGEAGNPANETDIGSFRIQVYATTRSSARSLCRSVADAIEAADAAGSITFDEGALLYLRRSGSGIDQLDPDPGPSGQDVWSHTIQFRAIVEAAS
jgi:hypothetical protein